MFLQYHSGQLKRRLGRCRSSNGRHGKEETIILWEIRPSRSRPEILCRAGQECPSGGRPVKTSLQEDKLAGLN